MITVDYEPNKFNPLTGKLCNLLVLSDGKNYSSIDIRGIRKQAALVEVVRRQLEALCRK